MSHGLTIYLADDHAIVAEAIAGLLRSLSSVGNVRTFSGGKDLYTVCKGKKPDLIILDVEMPHWNGIQTLEKIKEVCTVPVLMLSMNDEKAILESAIQAGAAGYLHKNCSIVELEKAIATVMTGEFFLSEEVKKIMLGLKATYSPFAGLSEELTEREYEVLQLVCEGLTSKEIGERLFVSPRTIEARKTSIMQKFNVQTTGKLIALAIKNKIVK